MPFYPCLFFPMPFFPMPFFSNAMPFPDGAENLLKKQSNPDNIYVRLF